MDEVERSTTAGMQEVGQCLEQLPRTPEPTSPGTDEVERSRTPEPNGPREIEETVIHAFDC